METQPRYETNRIGEEIELNEGEELCNKCDGTGYDTGAGGFFNPPCSKCQGEKKLDWVSKITGVAPKPSMFAGSGSYTNSTSGPGHSHSFINTGQGNITITLPQISTWAPSRITLDADQVDVGDKPMKEYIEEIVAKKIAEEVDKRIMSSFNIQKEQIQNKLKRRKFFGNGVISKLLLLCDPKQRFRNKSKKD